MERGLQGRYEKLKIGGEEVRSFIPNELPLKQPLQLNTEISKKIDNALVSLGRLDSISEILPDSSLFLYMYVRKEAVLSSMIEGTQSSISDLLVYELDGIPGVPIDDAMEVSNYVKALEYGVNRIDEGFPISSRLFKEIHNILLSKGRGCTKEPGEYRTSQNWIGGTRPGNAVYVPPPPSMVDTCMGNLENFLHDIKSVTPVLLKAAISHVQFETIHPFLDGNGRLGRLLISLLLYENKILQKPLLYLSLYFKIHRQEYYEHLTNVRIKGDWEKWIDFFAEAVVHTSNQAVKTARNLINLINHDEAKVNNMGRASSTALTVYRCFVKNPILNASAIQNQSSLSIATIHSSLDNLVTLGILEEVSQKKRNKIYAYKEYINILNEGTE